MPTTLRIPSFAQSNLRERTVLTDDVEASDFVLPVESNQGFAAGDVLFVGSLGQDGCESAVVSTVFNGDELELESSLSVAHKAYSTVTAVLGDRIRIYRAANVDDQPPAVDDFTVLDDRAIDPDSANSYYTDATGSADYWYRWTYWNETTSDETELGEFESVRGDDYGRYANNDEIRHEAGFDNAQNLKDYAVDQQRRHAESEINATFAPRYTTPFSPVPDIIHTLTVQLGAALLQVSVYGNQLPWSSKLKDIRLQIKTTFEDGAVTDEAGEPQTNTGVDYYPTDEDDSSFKMDDRF